MWFEMRRNLTSLILCAALTQAQAPNLDILAKIRAEATEHSEVAPVFEMLAIAIGPRLTASPATSEQPNMRATGLPPMDSTALGWSRGTSAVAGLLKNSQSR
jgi:hypothetical protein